MALQSFNANFNTNTIELIFDQPTALTNADLAQFFTLLSMGTSAARPRVILTDCAIISGTSPTTNYTVQLSCPVVNFIKSQSTGWINSGSTFITQSFVEPYLILDVTNYTGDTSPFLLLNWDLINQSYLRFQFNKPVVGINNLTGITLQDTDNGTGNNYTLTGGTITRNAVSTYLQLNETDITALAAMGIGTSANTTYVSMLGSTGTASDPFTDWLGEPNQAIANTAALQAGYVGNAGSYELASTLLLSDTDVSLEATGRSLLGNVTNVEITGGSSGQFLQTDGAGNLTWATAGGGGGSGNSISNGNTDVSIGTANGSITGNVWAANGFILPALLIERNTGSGRTTLGSGAGWSSQGANAVAIGACAASFTQGASSLAVGAFAALGTQGTEATAVGFAAAQTSQGNGAVALGFRAGSNRQSQYSIAIGHSAAQGNGSIANSSQGNAAVAIGQNAGELFQGNNSVAIGFYAANASQGIAAVAIGSLAGSNTQGANSVAIGINAGANTQGNSAIAIGEDAGSDNQRANAVAIGIDAGVAEQGNAAVAIGQSAGQVTQGNSAIAIGEYAGRTTQGPYSVAIGLQAGQTTQGTYGGAVAVGYQAGQNTQGEDSVAVGSTAGANTQGYNSVAIGRQAGQNTQGANSVAVGYLAGNDTQGANSVAVGRQAGRDIQGDNSVAIGYQSGFDRQGGNSVSVGYFAGQSQQGANAVALGYQSGYTTQGNYSVALGYSAGFQNQGTNSIAIGANAGASNQPVNSIILNATGSNLNSITSNTFTVKPIRMDASFTTVSLYYNSTTGEITYANTTGGGGASDRISNVNTSIEIPTANGNIQFYVANGTNAKTNVMTLSSNGLQIIGGNLTTTGTGVSTITSGSDINLVTGANSTGNVNVYGNLFVTRIANLGPVSNVIITGGANGQYLRTNGSGTLSWQSIDTSLISNGNSNVTVAANSVVLISATGQANIINVYSNGSHATTTIADDVLISGNITVQGNTNYINVQSFTVVDPIIVLGAGANGAVPPENTNDLGTLLRANIAGEGGVDRFMGWDTSNTEFVFGSNVADNNNIITINSLGNIRASTVIANITSNGNSAFTGNVNLGAVGNIRITGGTANQFLQTDGTGTLTWADGGGGGGGGTGITEYSGSVNTVNPIATSAEIDITLPIGADPNPGDLFVDTSTRTNNTQPLYVFTDTIGWLQLLTARGV